MTRSLYGRREPLKGAFGFKGGALTELWQVGCRLGDSEGGEGFGMGVQSVLWSDAAVFHAHTQDEANALMLSVTRRALEKADAESAPMDSMPSLREEIYAYAKEVTGCPELRETFALNALVPVDLALWQLHRKRTARAGKPARFSNLAGAYTHALTEPQEKLGNIPLISYQVTAEEILGLAQEHFLLKIKLGMPGTPDEMLRADCARLQEIHELTKELRTPYTDSGRVLFYIDLNGRYDTPGRVDALLAFADKIGALCRIALLEEPFPETTPYSVASFPVRVAADESAHTARDAARLMDELGYTALALKPIAKTLSVTLEVLEQAYLRGVPCFCADLTVNPWMADWNKCLAARLKPLPGLKIGVVESNGPQNYRNWAAMLDAHPQAGGGWIVPQGGIFTLNRDFLACDGGIFDVPSFFQPANLLTGGEMPRPEE